MVTDIVNERARTSISYPWRLLLTLLLLAAYVYGGRLSLPGVDREALLSVGIRGELSSVLALGLSPLVTGFLLVELFSLLTPPGRRLRQLGAAGRATLNRAALIVSLLLAAIQALGIAKWLEAMTALGRSPFVASPGPMFLLLTVLTLTAATAAIFALCQFLSAYGIGNGFALLILTTGVLPILNRGAAILKRGEAVSFQGIVLLLFAGGVALVVRFFRTAEDAWLPAFPQGVVPAQVAVVLSTLLWPVLWPAIAVRARIPLADGPGLAVPLLVALALIPLLSWLTFHLFSSRSRLQANLSDPEEFLDDLAASLRRRAIAATALLTLGTAAYLVATYTPHTFTSSVGFAQIVVIVAIGLDLWDQFRFQRRVGATALLTQLDNVHFSYRLEEQLQEAGIEALARGHQFRSLTFFFGALFKIDMLVPVEQLGRARSVLAELEMAREIRAF
jgi:hypothetical protein